MTEPKELCDGVHTFVFHQSYLDEYDDLFVELKEGVKAYTSTEPQYSDKYNAVTLQLLIENPK